MGRLSAAAIIAGIILSSPALADSAATNSVSVTQSGTVNILVVIERGATNSVVATQIGAQNYAYISERGVTNAVSLQQIGAHNTSKVSQQGSNNSATIRQSGGVNQSVINQVVGKAASSGRPFAAGSRTLVADLSFNRVITPFDGMQAERLVGLRPHR